MIEEAVCVEYAETVGEFPNVGDLTVNIDGESYKCQRSWTPYGFGTDNYYDAPARNKDLMEIVQTTVVYHD
jgi:hypothetical protein